MELQTNGADVKNGTANETTQHAAPNGAVKKDAAAAAKPQNGAAKAEPEKAKPAVAQEQPKPADPAPEQPAKPELSLDAKLKLVSDLHRRSVQRLNLISRMMQLEGRIGQRE